MQFLIFPEIRDTNYVYRVWTVFLMECGVGADIEMLRQMMKSFVCYILRIVKHIGPNLIVYLMSGSTVWMLSARNIEMF